MELFGQDVVKCSNFLLCKVVLFASSITNQVQKQFEESALEIRFGILRGLILVEYLDDGLKGMFEVQRAIVWSNQFVWNDD